MKVFELILVFILLLGYSNSTCQTSASPQKISESRNMVTTGFTGSEQILVGVLEDSSGNTYEIGQDYSSNKTSIRKVGPSGNTLATAYYTDIRANHYSSYLTQSDTKLAICGMNTLGHYIYVEISTVNLSLSSHNLLHSLSTNSGATRDNIQCGISPTKNIIFYTGNIPGIIGYFIVIAKSDITNLGGTGQYKVFSSNLLEWFSGGTLAFSDTEFCTAGVTTSSGTYNAICVFCVTWSSSSTLNWSKKYLNGVGDTTQNMRLIAYPDNSKVINVCQDSNKDILILIFNKADGSLFKKGKASAGLARLPLIYSLSMIDSSSLLITTRDDNAGVLLNVNLNDFTGTSYSGAAGTYYYGLSGKLSDNNFYLSGGNESNQKQVLHKLSSSHMEWWKHVLTRTTNFVFQEITNTDYDVSDKSLTFSNAQTGTFPNHATTFTDDSTTVSDEKSLVLNSWASATAQTIVAGTTGGTFTPDKLPCVTGTGMTAPSVAYSLVAGSGSVPSWTSIDSSTAEITYNTPTSTSSEMFSVRSTFGGNSATIADTSISVSVTEAPSAATPGSSPTSASSGNSNTEDKSSGDKSCGITSGTGACIGAYIGIAIGGVLVIGGMIFALVLITKYFNYTPTAHTGSTAVPEAPKTEVGLKQTQEPIKCDAVIFENP